MNNRRTRDSKFVQGKISTGNLKNPAKYVGRYKDDIEYLSSLEYYFINYCDSNDNIMEWSSEEIVIPYKDPIDNRVHRYFPDFYIKFKNFSGRVEEALIEIKPKRETLDKPYLSEKMSESSKKHSITTWVINQSKWKSGREYCNQRRMKFLVITEEDLTPIKSGDFLNK